MTQQKVSVMVIIHIMSSQRKVNISDNIWKKTSEKEDVDLQSPFLSFSLGFGYIYPFY